MCALNLRELPLQPTRNLPRKYLMENSTNWVEKRKTMRANAEGMVAPFSAPKADAEPLDVLCHELMVHKVELEMQIEEMRQANFEMQELSEIHRSRYELGPVASFSIDAKGMVSDANMAGAHLLGCTREQLVNVPFAKFLATAADADRWHLLYRQRMQEPGAAQRPFVLSLGRTNGPPLQVFCSTSTLARGARGSVLQMVLFDLAELQLAQA